MTQTLGQVIASDAAARSQANKRTGTLHKTGQKHDLFSGFARTYMPFEALNEDGTGGVPLPPETKRVQQTAEDLIREYAREMAAAVDWAAAKDRANCDARADVVVGGEVLLRDVPATHLLHLEKIADDAAAFVSKLPVLPADETWDRDEDNGLWRTQGTAAIRNEQEPVPLVLHPGTDKHAPQVHAVTRQVPKGKWTTVKHSGALSPVQKRELEDRVAGLRTAFKRAREEANRAPAESAPEAHVIFGYLFP